MHSSLLEPRLPWRNIALFGLINHVASVAATAASSRPVSVTFGPEFLGYDGSWSAAQIRVGFPEQYLSTFPATLNSETWVVGAKGCDGSLTCQTLRGGLYSPVSSKSWSTLGQYQLGYSALSQTTEPGYYGFDRLAVSDSVEASGQTIAVVNDTTHWIGQLGLNVQNTRFNGTTDDLPFLSSLVQVENQIPSHSYGYTAGAYYKDKSVLGSLTLGGVDTARFVPNNVTFALGQGYAPVVAVNSITVSSSSTTLPLSWNANPTTLLPQDQAAVFTIDSSTPFLWLPESVCDQFASALDLTYDQDLQVYRYSNKSSAQALKDLDLKFEFVFANTVSADQSFVVSLSYDAFNQQLSYPFPGLYNSYNSTKVDYFPIRRASSANQYTIGRVLLQEVYLLVDYERNLFSLSQALFPAASSSPQLKAITRPLHSTWPGPNSSSDESGLSPGAKAGIAIAFLLLLIGIVIAFWYFCFRHRKHGERLDEEGSTRKTGISSIFSRRTAARSAPLQAAVEMQGDKRQPKEMVADGSNTRFELASVTPVEMPAAEVPPTFFQEERSTNITLRNDPRTPVEMIQPQQRSSIAKSGALHPVWSRAPAPPYNHQAAVSHGSNDVSSNATDVDTNVYGKMGGNIVISPVTGSISDSGSTHAVQSPHPDNVSRCLSSSVSPVIASGKQRDAGDVAKEAEMKAPPPPPPQDLLRRHDPDINADSHADTDSDTHSVIDEAKIQLKLDTHRFSWE